MAFQIQKYNSVFQKPDIVAEPFPWVGHIPFAFFLIEFLKPQIVVELGVHTGNSFNAFCQTAKTLGIATKCYGVDTWKGEAHAGIYEEKIFNTINAYHKQNYQGISTLIRKTFDEAVHDFQDKTIDLLHIDGLHTYEAVKNDYQTWLPKMKEGGVILFHDTQVRRDDFGVWKLWEEITPLYTSFEFTHSHGLGIIIVGSNPEFEDFINAIRNEKFIQNLFVKLGEKIEEVETGKMEFSNGRMSTLNKIASLEKELTELHAKAENMRLKNRIKRLFFLK